MSQSPTLAVTAATGQLGQLVIATLLARGVEASHIVAIVRNPAKAQNLAAQGVQVRQADYKSPVGWAEALVGVDRVLLISSSDLDNRVGQHRTVIEAAKAAGVQLLAYTSLLDASKARMSLAADHQDTEKLLSTSGVPYVLLRDGWYLENYDLKQPLQSGVILGAAGTGRVSAAARKDYAEAAAAVLTSDNQAGKVYELGGDTSFSLSDLATELSRQSGKEVTYRNLSTAEYQHALEGFGLPASVAHMLASSDEGVTRGELETRSSDLHDLIGRPTTTLADYVASALKK